MLSLFLLVVFSPPDLLSQYNKQFHLKTDLVIHFISMPSTAPVKCASARKIMKKLRIFKIITDPMKNTNFNKMVIKL